MFSVGTDTEFFLQNRQGHYKSAIKYITGTKFNPINLPSGGHLSYDNVSLEFATAPVVGEKEFVSSIKKSLSDSIKHIPTNISLSKVAGLNFPEKELNTEESRIFGCSPDFDAWEFVVNIVPTEAAFLPFRSCGGHLHIGYLEKSGNEFLLDPIGKILAVKALDVFLGIPFTVLDNSRGTKKRRTLYGKAGCHRPTEYGVEYRTLSNFWLFSPKLVRLVHRLTTEAMGLIRDGKIEDIIAFITEKTIRTVIDKNQKQNALNIWNTILVPRLHKETTLLFDTCKRDKPYDIYKEWGLV